MYDQQNIKFDIKNHIITSYAGFSH